MAGVRRRGFTPFAIYRNASGIAVLACFSALRR
jgi:undecaprenyl pyrophosphate phosphatase UppP